MFGLSCFSAHFADVVSRALNIPKWRLFNIRTEEAEVGKCQKAMFGIIGDGILFCVIYHIKLLLRPIHKKVTVVKAYTQESNCC